MAKVDNDDYLRWIQMDASQIKELVDMFNAGEISVPRGSAQLFRPGKSIRESITEYNKSILFGTPKED